MEGFIRPEMIVLPENALVPAPALIVPPPNQFTHRLKTPQPFYYGTAQADQPPDGTLDAGTQVVLLGYDEGPTCRVVDSVGRHVETVFAGLEPVADQ